MSTALEVITRVLPAEHAENAIQLLDERELTKLAAYADEIDDLLERAFSTPLSTPEEAAKLAELMARSVRAQKDLEGMRKARVAPLNAEVKAINALVGRLVGPLEQFDTQAKRQIGAWNAAEADRVRREREAQQRQQEEAARREAEAEAKRAAAERAEREARERAAQAASAAERRKQEALAAKARQAQEDAERDAQAASMAQAQATVAAPREAARGIRTDSGSISLATHWTFEVVDASQVPREFLTVDEKAIRAAVLAGTRVIPGVNVFSESLTKVRIG